jgi:hypothetical protein
MTIEQKDIIDVVSISKNREVVRMSIIDTLGWENEEEHLRLLQTKIYRYLDVIESGELYEVYPLAKNKKIEITIYALYELTNNATEFICNITNYLKKMGYVLLWVIDKK